MTTVAIAVLPFVRATSPAKAVYALVVTVHVARGSVICPGARWLTKWQPRQADGLVGRRTE